MFDTNLRKRDERLEIINWKGEKVGGKRGDGSEKQRETNMHVVFTWSAHGCLCSRETPVNNA
jgi:hypothetical protein